MFDRRLVATAFDDNSELACDLALRLAQLSEGTVHIAHVIATIGDEPDDPELEEFYAGLQAKAAERMRAVSERFHEVGVEHTTELRIGIRWEGILAAADGFDADVIVLGSRPVLEQDKPRLGTTSHQVFFASRRPLLVARR